MFVYKSFRVYAFLYEVGYLGIFIQAYNNISIIYYLSNHKNKVQCNSQKVPILSFEHEHEWCVNVRLGAMMKHLPNASFVVFDVLYFLCPGWEFSSWESS